MGLETKVILKSILMNIYKAKNLKEAQKAVEVLLDKEDVALVREQSDEYIESQKKDS